MGVPVGWPVVTKLCPTRAHCEAVLDGHLVNTYTRVKPRAAVVGRTMRLSSLGVIVTLALCLLLTPLAADAQQAGKVPRIGFLFYGSPGPSPELDAFRQGLRELGYIEGQNITIEYRFASGRGERLPALAAELGRLKMDVIANPGTP